MRREAQRGGALVEFAMIAPFMVIIFMSAIEFGYVMYLKHTVDYAARIGSRWAAVRGNVCSDSSVCPATAAEIQTYVRSVVPGLASPAAVTPTWTAPPSSYKLQPTGTCGSGTDETPGCVVNITVTKPIRFVIPFITTKSITLTSSSQAVIQN
jgi:Flp pilus assembly protein TadG